MTNFAGYIEKGVWSWHNGEYQAFLRRQSQKRDGQYYLPDTKEVREPRTLDQNAAMHSWSTIIGKDNGNTKEEFLTIAMDNIGMSKEIQAEFSKRMIVVRDSTKGMDTKELSLILTEIVRIKDFLNEGRPQHLHIILPKKEDELYSRIEEERGRPTKLQETL